MKRIILVVTLSVLVLGSIAYQLTRNKEAERTDIAQETAVIAPSVEVIRVMAQPMCDALEATGTLEARQTLPLLSETDGRVIEASFRVGDWVKPGQPLIRTDPSVKQLNRQLAEINYQKAKRDYERLDQLYQEHNATQVEVENARLQTETAENQLRTTANTLALSRIAAPIGGMIAEKKAGLGDYLQVGTPVAVISDIRQLIGRVNLTEQEVTRVKKGDAVRVISEAFADRPLTGSVFAIVPQPTQAKTFPVQVLLDNIVAQPLLPGMGVRVVFNAGRTHDALVIPRRALTGDFARPTLWVVRDKKVERRAVVLGNDYGTLLEVRQGLRAGELVIVVGQQNVSHGDAIPRYVSVNY